MSKLRAGCLVLNNKYCALGQPKCVISCLLALPFGHKHPGDSLPVRCPFPRQGRCVCSVSEEQEAGRRVNDSTGILSVFSPNLPREMPCNIPGVAPHYVLWTKHHCTLWEQRQVSWFTRIYSLSCLDGFSGALIIFLLILGLWLFFSLAVIVPSTAL